MYMCNGLRLSTLGKIFGRQHFEIFFLFVTEKKEFDILCKFFSVETICMKYQIWFSAKNKKTISSVCRLLNQFYDFCNML